MHCAHRVQEGDRDPSGVEVFVALAPIDLRWGFDRLAGLVQEQIGRRARSGALFVFFGKRKTALKILFFDGSGLCLFYKRLDSRIFRVPEALQPVDAFFAWVDQQRPAFSAERGLVRTALEYAHNQRDALRRFFATTHSGPLVGRGHPRRTA